MKIRNYIILTMLMAILVFCACAANAEAVMFDVLHNSESTAWHTAGIIESVNVAYQSFLSSMPQQVSAQVSIS